MRRVRYQRIRVLLLCALPLCVLVPSLVAQSFAAEDVSCTLGIPAGARRFRPGSWGLVSFRATNTSNKAVAVQGVFRFVDAPTLQFSRRMTVPPMATLRTACPVLVPDTIGPEKRSTEFTADPMLPADGKPMTSQATSQEMVRRARAMMLDQESPTVGMISELNRAQPLGFEHPFHTLSPTPWKESDVPFYDMVLAAKRARNLSRRVSIFDLGELPAGFACLDVLDVVMVSSDRIASDPAGLAELRSWTLGGGYLWITLDDVQVETVAAIMNDTFACTVVDRVELTSIAIKNAALTEQQVEPKTFDQPVRFVRVLPEGVRVTHTVDGWPAAFWQPFGEGRVYFTTLGPAPWMRHTTAQDQPPRNWQGDTPFIALDSLNEFADICLTPPRPTQLDEETLKVFLSQQIGYRILGRRTVVVILAVFCAALACLGWYLQRAEHLEWLLVGAPAIALVFGFVFLVYGTITRKSVPPTVATIAHVVLEPGVGVGDSSGLVAMYNQDTSSAPLGGDQGGVFFPEMKSLERKSRRLTWTDEDKWQWEELELPAGVRTAPFKYPFPLDKAIDCRAQFGPEGVEGHIGPRPFGALSDAVIVLAHENVLAASIDDDGNIRSSADDLLTRGDFTGGALLTDEQVRRNAIYERLLARRLEVDAPTRPVLYAWTQPPETGFFFPQENRTDSAVLSIPLRFEETPPGTNVRIPAPFLSYRSELGPNGEHGSVYGNLTRRWGETKLPTTQWLRFQVPSSVLPLKANKAKLTINIRAPSRTVEVLALAGKQAAVVTRYSHPIGTYDCVIDRPELLELDATGGLRLGIQVSDDESANQEDQMAQAPWKIEQVRLEVMGTVQGDQNER